MWWLPLLLLVALLFMTTAERFTEPAGSYAEVTRPTLGKNTLWSSKIAANTPFGTDAASYIIPLAAFYDEVYKPAANRPTEAEVDRFLTKPYPGTDVPTLKTIIMEAFHIDASPKNEQSQVVFEPSAILLEPKDGVDEVRVRTENEYSPEDTVGPFDESALGTLAPTSQTKPLREAPLRERELSPVENI
jgi:hypothetical protein